MSEIPKFWWVARFMPAAWREWLMLGLAWPNYRVDQLTVRPAAGGGLEVERERLCPTTTPASTTTP
jgi:hypothetical protein